jgi:hypothetical protein
MQKQLAEIWDYAQSVATAENILPKAAYGKTVSSESIKKL